VAACKGPAGGSRRPVQSGDLPGPSGGTLYGIDSTQSGANLYTLDTTTAAPTLIGDTNSSIESIRFVGNTLYGLEFSTQPYLDTIDTSTGQVTQVVQATSVLNGAPGSLTFLNSTTAVFATSSNELYEMDITAGNVTDLGNLSSALFDGLDYGPVELCMAATTAAI
jgi:hypothetical protein